jgi:hypothetical protein
MSASEVEDLIAPIDSERIHHPQILAPGFASHDEGNEPAEESPGISGVFGDEAGATHIPSSGVSTRIAGQARYMDSLNWCLKCSGLARRK